LARRWRAAAAAIAGPVLTAKAVAQTALSPDAAVQQLIDGNSRFAAGRMTSFDEDPGILRLPITVWRAAR